MTSDSFNKPINRFSLTTLVIASMIGAGVFTTSGFAIADLHHPWLVMLAWLVGGVIAICGAISYGQLVERLTENGGEYLFLTRFAHPSLGFIAGWVSLLAGFTGAGAYAASAFESYAMIDSFRPDWLPNGSVGILLVFLATAAHSINTRKGANGQNGLVVIKLSLLILFIIWSFVAMGNWRGGDSLVVLENDSSSVSLFVFATSVMWISLSYSGFNAAVYVAGEATQGSKDVSFAMICATAAVMFLYLCLNTIFLFAPEASSIAGHHDIATIAASAVGGATLSNIVRVTICLGLASSVSSVIMAGPRVYAKMAEDGVFPKLFASKVSPPTRSVVLQGIAISIVLLFASLQNLLSYLGMTLALSSAFTISMLFFSRNKIVERQSRWFAKIPAAIYVISTVILASLAAWNKPAEGIAVVVTLVTGGAAYFFFARKDDSKGIEVN